MTGRNVIGSILFPDASVSELELFLAVNIKVFNKKEKEIIRKLAVEAKNNQKLQIEVTNNSTILSSSI